ncbi:MAG: putative DNA-binding domain-containing protein [Rhodobiaceae bacterium]|nr:putative DNA-binding domain-containing protein [Rhodobiaceae bacterium]MCC0049382.1 putative DNA-binding domain-containing protein [Rhodobiaceae bacterium]
MSAQPDAPPKSEEGQDSFTAALFDASQPPPADVARYADGRLPVKRFSVYRNNVMVSLTEYLERTFPSVKALVGDEFFAGMAGVFIRQSPPSSPMLMEYGPEFPAFIESFEPAGGVPYLADVARLEDAQRAAYHAADAKPATPETLARAAQHDAAAVFIDLHPSLEVVASDWPILSILQANTDGTSTPLPQHGEDVLVVRPALDTRLHAMPAGAATFVLALKGGASLQDAAGAAQNASDAFDLSETLALLIAAGAIVDIRTV